MFHRIAPLLAICGLVGLSACDSAKAPVAPTNGPGDAGAPPAAVQGEPAQQALKPPDTGPIVIQRGELDLGGGAGGIGQISLFGNRGFSLVAQVDVSSGNVALCHATPCAPGATTSLLAIWLGNDLRGTVTLDGVTYSNLGSQFVFGTVQFDGSVVAPPLTRRGADQVRAPFTLTGEFVADNGGGNVLNVSFSGAGTATVDLAQIPGTSDWDVAHVLYRIKHSS